MRGGKCYSNGGGISCLHAKVISLLLGTTPFSDAIIEIEVSSSSVGAMYVLFTGAGFLEIIELSIVPCFLKANLDLLIFFLSLLAISRIF